MLGYFTIGYAESEPVFQQVPQAGDTEPDTAFVNHLLKEGRRIARTGEYKKSKKMIAQADSLSRLLHYSRGIEEGRADLADIYIDEAEYDRAATLLNEAIKKYPNSHEMFEYYNLLGAAYANLTEYQKGVDSFKKAIEHLYLIPPEEQEAARIKIYHNLGTIYFDLGENVQSFQNYLNAIESASAIKDTSMLILSYNNLGLAYDASDEYEKAEYYLNKSLSLAKKQNEPVNILRASLNLANTYSSQEEFKKADQYYSIAEKLFAKLRPNAPPAIILHGKGSNFAKMGEYGKAKSLLLQSLAMTQEMGTAEGNYFNNYVLGNLYLKTGNLDSASYYIDRAVAIAEQVGNSNHLEDSYQLLYKVYAKEGLFEKAFNVLKKHQALSDSLTELNRDRELANLESRLELNRQNEINGLLKEKQQQQEEKLKIQLILIIVAAVVIILIVVLLVVLIRNGKERELINAQLKQQKRELEEVNDTKNKLFAAVSHDLRTPLSSLQGVLYLLKEKAISVEELKEMIPQVETAVQRNVNVIEDLLTWAKDQLSGIKMEKDTIGVLDLVQKVIENQEFTAVEKNIEISITPSLTPQVAVEADMSSLQLVIRNLLTNSLKFTPASGAIRFDATCKEEHVTISIADNGIGIPSDKVESIFKQKKWSREGTQKEKGSGFGLSLSKEFVERMNGSIWFESEEGQGTTFFVKLPKAAGCA
jgi:signal transduction histidine kinase/Flp pilus assembly protein TadD